MIGVARMGSTTISMLCALQLCATGAVAQESMGQVSPTVHGLANVSETRLEVAWADGKLSADVKNAELKDVLTKIGQALKAQVDVVEGIPARVSVSFSGLSLEDGLTRLIKGEGAGIVICYDQHGAVTLIRVSKKAGVPPEQVIKVKKIRSYFSPQDQASSLSMDRVKELTAILRDSSKKRQWIVAAKQIIDIKSPEAKPYLKELTTHEDDFVRDEAVREYAMLVDAADAEFILELAEDKTWQRRVAAVEIAMPLVDDPRQVPILIRMLRDRDFAVQEAAIKAVGLKKTREAIPILEELLRTGEAHTRSASADALYSLTKTRYEWRTPDEKKAFEEQLRESHERLRKRAAEFEKQSH